jgi:hypothetical protein
LNCHMFGKAKFSLELDCIIYLQNDFHVSE